MKGSLDLITNAGSVSSRPISEYLSEAKSGRLPFSLLPTFLHEATHQWCLWSPVGSALSLLNLELHREVKKDALSLLVPSSVPIQARVSTARRILEPLLEGLAQFAEFDLYTGKSSVASSITHWTIALFGHEASKSIELDPLHRLRYLLLQFRASHLAVSRKSDMLVRPLTAERGGYLIGYLAVKNLWQSAQQRSKKLRDPDLFLMYLRSLVFDDYVLAEMLLGPPIDEYEDLNELVARVQQRLKLLMRADLDRHVEQFEVAVSGDKGLDGNWESIYLDNELALRGREASSGWIKSRANPDEQEKAAEHMAVTAYSTGDMASLLSRPTIRICVDEVSVEVSKGTCTVAYEGNALFAAPSYLVSDGSETGLLSLHFVPTYSSLALICSCDKGLVSASFFPCTETVSVPEDRQRALAEAMALVLRDDEMRAALHFVIDTDDFENLELGELQEWVPKVTPTITNLYLNFALQFVPDEKLDQCRALMQKHGFWNILCGTQDAPKTKAERVRALAALGLVTSCVIDREAVVHFLEDLGFCLDDVVADLEASSNEHGYLIGVRSHGSPGSDSRFVCLV